MKTIKTNVKQHHLPFAYLRAFAVDAAAKRDNSRIWMMDTSKIVNVKTEKQGVNGRYFYSEDTVKESTFWTALETRWTKDRDDTDTMSSFSDPAYVSRMFDQMLFLHFRNAAFSNESGEDRLAALTRILPNLQKQALAQNAKEVGETWAVLVVEARDAVFYTSDNPVVLFYDDAGPPARGIQALGGPITPRQWLIVYDQNVWNLDAPVPDVPNLDELAERGELSTLPLPTRAAGDDDAKLLNLATLRNAVSQIYGPLPFTVDHQAEFTEVRKRVKTLLNGRAPKAIRKGSVDALRFGMPPCSFAQKRSNDNKGTQPSPNQ